MIFRTLGTKKNKKIESDNGPLTSPPQVINITFFLFFFEPFPKPKQVLKMLNNSPEQSAYTFYFILKQLV